MNRKILIWGVVGMAVACTWARVTLFAAPHFNLGRSATVSITAPVALLGRRMPIGVGSSIMLNGCFYAIAGLVFELMRKATSPLRTR